MQDKHQAAAPAGVQPVSSDVPQSHNASMYDMQASSAQQDMRSLLKQSDSFPDHQWPAISDQQELPDAGITTDPLVITPSHLQCSRAGQ